MFWLLKIMFPVSGSMRRLMHRKSVVFPPPDGPTIVTISPFFILNVIFFSMGVCWSFFERFLI
jgi:hypothetical protein